MMMSIISGRCNTIYMKSESIGGANEEIYSSIYIN